MNETEFLNDALNKLDAVVARTENERDRWQAILADVVGQIVAHQMYRDPERCPETPRPE